MLVDGGLCRKSHEIIYLESSWAQENDQKRINYPNAA